MNVEFNAQQTDSAGAGIGRMNFGAPIELPADEDNEFGETGRFGNFTMSVEFDCVVVEGDRAVMSGLVRSASVLGYSGRRVTLAVQDGGEGFGKLDKFTWGADGSRTIMWVPSDAERNFDEGWGLVWRASDAERPDDTEILIDRRRPTDCRSLPLSAYTLIDIPSGSGNLQIRP